MKRFFCASRKRSLLPLGLAILLVLATPMTAIAGEAVLCESPSPTTALTSLNNLQGLELQYYEAFFEGDYQLANRYANQLVQHDPSQSKYHLFVGQSLLSLGKLGESIKAFQTAVQLDPNSAMSHFLLANSLQSQGNGDVVALLEKAHQLDPSNTVISLLLAIQYGQPEQNEQSLELFQEAVENNPDADLFYFALGMAKLTMEVDDYGATEFRRALQINPDYTEAETYLEHAVGSFWLEHQLEQKPVLPQ